MTLVTLRAIATVVIGDLRTRARRDERGMSTMEYAVIIAVVLALAVVIVGVIMTVGQQKISGIR